MGIDIALLIVIITRTIIIATLYFGLIRLWSIASKFTISAYTLAAGGYLYYVSKNTITTIPHGPDDVLRLITIAALIVILYKHIRRPDE